MERRVIDRGLTNVRVESRDDGAPVITGYAAVYYDGTPGTEYEAFGMRERIMPGAFDDALSDDVRALFNHDSNHVLGRSTSGTLRLSVDARGLVYEVTPPTGASGLIESIERGDISGSSFAFQVVDQEWRTEDEDDIREIHAVRLFDVGPVTYPAYEGTSTGVRALGDTTEAEEAVAEYRAQKEATNAKVLKIKEMRERVGGLMKRACNPRGYLLY